MKDNSTKIIFLVKLAGWLCLLPAAASLIIYRYSGQNEFLFELVTSVLFGVFALTTARAKRWQNPNYLMNWACISIIVVALLPAIPLFFAYKQAKKINKG